MRLWGNIIAFQFKQNTRTFPHQNCVASEFRNIWIIFFLFTKCNSIEKYPFDWEKGDYHYSNTIEYHELMKTISSTIFHLFLRILSLQASVKLYDISCFLINLSFRFQVNQQTIMKHYTVPIEKALIIRISCFFFFFLKQKLYKSDEW